MLFDLFLTPWMLWTCQANAKKTSKLNLWYALLGVRRRDCSPIPQTKQLLQTPKRYKWVLITGRHWQLRLSHTPLKIHLSVSVSSPNHSRELRWGTLYIGVCSIRGLAQGNAWPIRVAEQCKGRLNLLLRRLQQLTRRVIKNRVGHTEMAFRGPR